MGHTSAVLQDVWGKKLPVAMTQSGSGFTRCMELGGQGYSWVLQRQTVTAIADQAKRLVDSRFVLSDAWPKARRPSHTIEARYSAATIGVVQLERKSLDRLEKLNRRHSSL